MKDSIGIKIATLATVCAAVTAAIIATGCSLKQSGTAHVYVQFPIAGKAAASTQSLGELIGAQTGSDLFSTSSAADIAAETTPPPLISGLPPTLDGFTCFGINVTGPGISPEPRLVDPYSSKDPACGTTALQPSVMAGLASIKEGSVDVVVPSGPGRTIQLFAVMSSRGCPLMQDILNEAGASGGKVSGIEEPIELGRVTTDVLSDMSVSIHAAYDPITAHRALCGGGSGSGTATTTGGGPHLAINLPFDTGPVGSCVGPVKVQFVDSTSTPISVGPTALSFTVIDSLNGAYYSNSTCSAAASPSSFVIAAEQSSSADFYVRPNLSIAGSLAAQPTTSGIGMGISNFYSYASGGPTHFARMNIDSIGPLTVGVCSPLIAVKLTDMNGVAVNEVAGMIGLSGGALGFYSDAGCTSSTNYLNLSGGTPLQFYYKPPTAGLGSIQLSVSSASLPYYSANYLFPVNPGNAAASITINPHNLVIAAGDSFQFNTNGGSGSYNYTLSSSLTDSLTATGYYTVPLTISTPGASTVNVQDTVNAALHDAANVSIRTFNNVDLPYKYSNGDTDGRSVAVAPNGDVYITGASEHTLGRLITRHYSNGVLVGADDAYQLNASFPTEGNAVAVAVSPSGIAYVGGNAQDSTNTYCLIRSQNPSWATFKQDSVPGDTPIICKINALAINGAGDVYVAGSSYSSASKWMTGRYTSSAVGSLQSWAYASGFPGQANAIAIDPTTTYVYAAGFAKDSLMRSHWLVRKSIDGGGSWTIIDDYQTTTGMDAEAYAMVVNNGSLYVAGMGTVAAGDQRWLVRKYSLITAGPATTFDSFQLSAGLAASAQSITVGMDGSIYVAGYATQSAVKHGIIRKTSNGGMNWSTISDYLGAPSLNTQFNAVSLDPMNRLFVAGTGAISSVNAMLLRMIDLH